MTAGQLRKHDPFSATDKREDSKDLHSEFVLRILSDCLYLLSKIEIGMTYYPSVGVTPDDVCCRLSPHHSDDDIVSCDRYIGVHWV